MGQALRARCSCYVSLSRFYREHTTTHRSKDSELSHHYRHWRSYRLLHRHVVVCIYYDRGNETRSSLHVSISPTRVFIAILFPFWIFSDNHCKREVSLFHPSNVELFAPYMIDVIFRSIIDRVSTDYQNNDDIGQFYEKEIILNIVLTIHDLLENRCFSILTHCWRVSL